MRGSSSSIKHIIIDFRYDKNMLRTSIAVLASCIVRVVLYAKLNLLVIDASWKALDADTIKVYYWYPGLVLAIHCEFPVITV